MVACASAHSGRRKAKSQAKTPKRAKGDLDRRETDVLGMANVAEEEEEELMVNYQVSFIGKGQVCPAAVICLVPHVGRMKPFWMFLLLKHLWPAQSSDLWGTKQVFTSRCFLLCPMLWR